MRKHFLTVTLFLAFYLPFSCGVDDSCGGGSSSSKYINALTATSGSYVDSQFFEKDSVGSEEAGIKITITEVLQEAFLPSPKRLSFFSNAYACSYIEQLAHTLEAVTITSDDDVEVGNQLYEAGSDISLLFNVTRWDELPSVADFVNQVNEDPYFFLYEEDFVVFRLIDQASKIDQSFQFEFTFSDRVLVVSTDRVIISD